MNWIMFEISNRSKALVNVRQVKIGWLVSRFNCRNYFGGNRLYSEKSNDWGYYKKTGLRHWNNWYCRHHHSNNFASRGICLTTNLQYPFFIKRFFIQFGNLSRPILTHLSNLHIYVQNKNSINNLKMYSYIFLVTSDFIKFEYVSDWDWANIGCTIKYRDKVTKFNIHVSNQIYQAIFFHRWCHAWQNSEEIENIWIWYSLRI